MRGNHLKIRVRGIVELAQIPLILESVHRRCKLSCINFPDPEKFSKHGALQVLIRIKPEEEEHLQECKRMLSQGGCFSNLACKIDGPASREVKLEEKMQNIADKYDAAQKKLQEEFKNTMDRFLQELKKTSAENKSE